MDSDLRSKAATRLTSLPAEELGATISADGKWVAYVANYEGASEVYDPVAGGVAKRVSFENSRVRVQGLDRQRRDFIFYRQWFWPSE